MPIFLKKKTVGETVYELGLARIHRAYELFDHVTVSFSGGKDSTVCLHLALEVAQERERLPLDVFFFDEEVIHPETIEYMRRVSQRDDVRLRWYRLPVKHRNACSRKSPYWFPWAPDDKEKWCRELPPEAITELAGFARKSMPECNGLLFPQSLGSAGVIVGLRATESLRRYRVVARRVADNFIAQDPHARHVQLAKPIYDWTTDDVWTAPRLFDWDYNRTYDVFQKAGMTRHQQRVCPPYGEEPLGGLYKYALCWPDLWEKMLQRVPGAATAARYARTPLYASGDVPSWDASDDPKKLIERALSHWPTGTRRQIRERINLEIRNHYRKTKEPIPAELPGETGVTWKYLYMLAVRGDFKGRRTPHYVPDKDTRY
ncbi:MAG: phosphoadenosine phosphosulfate reductase family protein [Planctomycetes bacterium]|nr:phosphoadenosine phosphosulfate reductase family protein [Planctomycetota bacterium]MBI3835145.1 phosphoadenosine phosphosulfate reductase family protein [Planctomycetota bacterium]